MKNLMLALSVFSTLVIAPNYVGAVKETALIDDYGITISDKVWCNDEMNVYGYTEAKGNVEEIKIFYTLYRGGTYIKNFSNTDDDLFVSITKNHSGNDKSESEGGPLWEVDATHKVVGTSSNVDKRSSYDSAFGKCRYVLH